MTSICAYHIRFTAETTTPISIGEFKGSALRGAWLSYSRRSFCQAPMAMRSDPLHKKLCPICYLSESGSGGEPRRAYALQPPLSLQTHYEPGDRFQFTFSLFDNVSVVFPYVFMGVREMGSAIGIGDITEDGRRGTFDVVRVDAFNRFTGESQVLWQSGDEMVESPRIAITDADIQRAAERIASSGNQTLRLNLLTPVRNVYDQRRLVHSWDTDAFLRRLIQRVYHLDQQFGSAPDRRSLYNVMDDLQPTIDAISVIDDSTEWWDVKGHSNRQGKTMYLGGLIGSVTLASDNWRPILPYLLWGESVQVGKNVVKGSGLYNVEAA